MPEFMSQIQLKLPKPQRLLKIPKGYKHRLINELSKIFNKLKIDTKDALDASTKWNFHKYMPGLVGGHCIGVDPYYLTYKAKN